MKKSLLAVLLFLGLVLPATSQEYVSFYEVKEIPIIQQGDNSANMRDKAITAGQRTAMEIMQQKLISKKYINSPRNISDAQINTAIDSVEVRDEKIYTKSYRAKLNVTFNPRVISQIFNVPFIKPVPLPEKYLVIPILVESDGTKLWRHKWWDVMKKIKNKNLILPLGDLEDVRNLTREDYSVRDMRNLPKLQSKYGSTAILLASVEYFAAEKYVTLSVEKIKNTDVQTYSYDIKNKEFNSEAEAFAAAANELVRRINSNNFDEMVTVTSEEEEEAVKNIPALNKKVVGLDSYESEPEDEPIDKSEPIINESQVTDVFVIADDLNAWSRMRAKITKNDLVKNIRIKSFTAGKAFIGLEHNGELVDVITKLEQAGLTAKLNGKYWEIREKK